MIENPWKGLVSYEEADIDKYQFCGRTEAVGKFYSLLTNNLFSTLYGRTGCGKTSMLRAGIFPLLRQESFFPVECRASLRSKEEAFADYMIKLIEEEIDKLGFWYVKSNIPVEHVGDDEKYKLWKYFYGNVFKDSAGNIVFPVIVLDQFEEILISAKDDSLKLLEQIHILVGDDLLLPDDCYANFRISFSLREDYLYLLEDALESKKLYSLRENRMRLAPLSHKEACEVISLGDDFMIPEDRDNIYETILRLSGNKGGHISTNMLSLICSQVYQLYDSHRSQGKLSLQNVKILAEDPLKDFYLSSIKDINQDTVKYIEEAFVDHGRRRLISLEDFKTHVPDEKEQERLTTGKTKILQVLVASDNECIELIHDTLARTIFKVYESRSKLSIGQKAALVAESIFVPVFCACYAIDAFLTNASILNLALFTIVVLLNWTFSLSSHGGKNLSNWIYFTLFIFSSGVSLFCMNSADGDNHLIFAVMALSFTYCAFIPIINMGRKKSAGPMLDLQETAKYIIRFSALNDNKELYKICMCPFMISMLIAIAFVNGFFMSSIGLWVLPICGVTCSSLLYKYFFGTNQSKIRRDVLLVMFFISLTVFVLVQRSPSIIWKIIALYFVTLLPFYALEGLSEEISSKQRRRYIISHIVICGLVLPFFFLGYNPFKFKGYGRDLTQPKIVSELHIPLLSLHDKHGHYALADRHHIIFEADFTQIDSVSYDYYTWSNQKKYWDYRFIEQYITTRDSEPDITLHTTSGTYSWSTRYSSRGNSSYLEDRIASLEKAKFGEWTEEEFAEIAELSAAYAARGAAGDSLRASKLELNYFFRRLLQAEIYQAVEQGNFVTDPETCRSILEYYTSSMNDSTYQGNFVPEFKRLADSNTSLQQRAFRLLKLQPGTSLEMISEMEVDSLVNLLESYKISPVQLQWAQNAIDKSEEMLYQSREGWGQYVVDSIYVANYAAKESDSFEYNNSCAWFNIFLCRFEEAEKFARKSVECSPSDKSYKSSFGYTNLITSLFLQNNFADAKGYLEKNKGNVVYEIKADFEYLLFPVQAAKHELTVVEGVCQDLNHFMQIGIIKDTTITEYRELRQMLKMESPLMSGTVHRCYADGWKLWTGNGSYKLINEDGRSLPVFNTIDVNIRDSVAICKMESGKYRYLDLKDMTFIGDEYDYAWHFSEGLAAVESNSRVGFINDSGEFVTEPKYRTEEWLRKDHYRLAFHDGKIAVANEKLYYELVDLDGNKIWGGNSFPYVKWNKNGIILKITTDGEWNTATPNEGYLRKTFNAEIEDILVNPGNDTIPIYNHYDIKRIEMAEIVPESDISGLWKGNVDLLYLGKHTSDCMLIGNKTVLGCYYITLTDYGSWINLIWPDSPGTNRITLSDDRNVIYVGDRAYYKIRDL